jgi:uncharacterized protein
MSKPVNPSRLTGNAKCPLCKKPVSAEHTPFCSRGCKDRDLLQWLGEGYKVPGPSAEYEDSIDSSSQD